MMGASGREPGTGFRLRGALAAGFAALLLASAAEAQIVLRDVSSATGIDFRHTDGSSGRHYIVETVASGLATLDFDGDGLIDVYFLSGAPLRGTKADGPLPKNHLYRNLGGWKFADVTGRAGVGDTGFGLGVAVGDCDNDGWPDLYLNNFGPNVLYHNNGDGTFRDVTARAGVGRGNKVGAGANFLDAAGDGHLDLFVANYIQFSYELERTEAIRGVPMYPGPLLYPPQPNQFFRNRGDGTFAEATQSSGIGGDAGTGMGTVLADYDNDGRTDIFVCNDAMRNFLFHNLGGARFEEVGLAAAIAFNYGGAAYGNMGADAGDYDNDGLVDFFVTSYHRQLPALYRNSGDGFFEDVVNRSGAGRGAFGNVKWGCGLVDFDNDGFKDVFIGCGHLQDNIEAVDDTTTYLAAPVLLRNLGNGRFLNVSDSSGDGLKVKMVARGVAFDDLDNDGDVDVVVLNSRRQPNLLRNMLNETGSKHHWLQVQLRGVKTNRDGVGARVRVVAGDLVQIAEVPSGRGYQSHYGSRLHFGLGSHERVDRVEVHWIGGGVDCAEDVAVDRIAIVVEGRGLVPTTASGGYWTNVHNSGRRKGSGVGRSKAGLASEAALISGPSCCVPGASC